MPDPVKIKATIDKINAKYGPKTIKLAKSLKKQEFMSTGIEELDLILGGGLPIGKITMIYGPEGSGKSSFCMHMVSRYPIAAYIDAERGFNHERAAMFGVDLDRTLLVQPDYGEQALSIAIELASTGEIPFIVIDSVAALVPKKEYELEEETERLPGVALTAGILNRKIFPLNNMCNDNNVTVMFINQVRDKFNAMMFGEQTTLPGGHALKHACHVILKVGRKDKLVSSDSVVGMTCRFSTGVKNRSASPFQEADVPLIFNKGFVSPTQVKEAIKESRKQILAERKEREQQRQEES
jgi:recombination protein RecA